MGSGVALINTGGEAAWELKRTLTASGALAEPRQGQETFYASDISGDFSAIAREFLHEDIPHVHSVEIERY